MQSSLLYRRAVLVAVASLGGHLALAQPEPLKFGKLDLKEFNAKPLPADSAAEAVVLAEFGRARVIANAADNFQSELDVVVRIKIQKKAGFDWATVQVPLYGHQRLYNLKGFTYNVVNGELVKSKLEDDNKFTEDVVRQLRLRKFTMPNVREGSIIEYSYSMIAEHSTGLPGWSFQRTIPTRWSEYRTSVPDWFDYKTLMQGYLPLSIRERTEGSTIISQHPVRTAESRWVMKDVPALTKEPFITTLDDYESRIDFELSSLVVPGIMTRDVTRTWEKVENTLLEDEQFGLQLGRGGFLKDELAKLNLSPTASMETRVAAIHNMVRNAVKYNDVESIYTSGPLRKTFLEQHRGNAADVNLLLVAALRTANIPAEPVVLSTRSNGRVNLAQPMASRFNYVVASVTNTDGKTMLLDATEPLLPSGVLPERCLNKLGRVVAKNLPGDHWVDLTPSQRKIHYQQVKLTLDAQGALSGTVHEEYGGYAAASERSTLQEQGEPKYRSQFASQHSSWTVPKFTISNRQELAQPLKLDYEFTQPADDNATAGMLYLGALTEFSTDQNPFRHDNRMYPVDFGMQQDETTVLTLALPAGYEVAELPKPAVVELPEGGGRFLYSATPTEGGLQITSRMNLRKPEYTAAEYEHLREFYRLMLEKQAEKLVIKKKA
jgi:hypothetical protein